jgi:Mrp family chromosome partitioning ATPase
MESLARAAAGTRRTWQCARTIPQSALSHAGIAGPQHAQVDSRQQWPAAGGQELRLGQPRHLARPPQSMRGSSLHRVLGCPNEPGLTEYLSGTASVMEVMQRAKPNEDGTALPKGLSSLTFLPAGTDAENAADLSGNLRFAALLEAVAPLFDWIIVDSSPVNLVSDGVNLAHHCDGVLLVARGGTTEYRTAQRAISELKASRILGFVLNAVKDAPSSEDYYGSYGNETNSPGV